MGKEVNVLTLLEVTGAVMLVFLFMLVMPKPQSFNQAFGVGGYNPFAKPNIAFAMILASMSAATAPAATLMVVRQYRAYGPVTKRSYQLPQWMIFTELSSLDSLFHLRNY